MFKIIKNFNWIILSSFLCIFMGIVTFLTFINEGFIPLSDKNLQTLLIIDIFLLLIFFGLIFKNFYRFYYTGKKNKKGAQTNLKYISVFTLFTVIPSLVVAIFSLFIFIPCTVAMLAFVWCPSDLRSDPFTVLWHRLSCKHRSHPVQP